MIIMVCVTFVPKINNKFKCFLDDIQIQDMGERERERERESESKPATLHLQSQLDHLEKGEEKQKFCLFFPLLSLSFLQQKFLSLSLSTKSYDILGLSNTKAITTTNNLTRLHR